MIIFIDFDDVIFNTKRFKDDLADVFLACGISREAYEQSYYDPNDKRPVRTYDPRAQIIRIGKKVDIDKNKLTKSVNAFMKDTSQYIFADFIRFVQNCGRENVYVLSYGDIKFLGKKINNSGIKKYVDNVFFTDKLKSAMISDIVKNNKTIQKGDVFLIDDRTEQIQDVKEMFSGIITILIKRPEGRYQYMEKNKYCDFEAHNLGETAKIIKNLI